MRLGSCTREGNACGPWTFCHLMTEMANEPLTGITPEDFTKQWLEQWGSTYDVNEDSVDARAAMQSLVIDPWLAASGGEQLDLAQSPFRLLAIMNRLDLRTETTGGGGGYFGRGGTTPANAGELRFVFGVMAPKGDGAACEPLPFTVIFEYGVPKNGCTDVRDWANQWVALDTMGGFGGAYNDALEQLTEPVVQRGAAPSRGNGSAINQIRTNEIALGDEWELREFALTTQTYGCSPSDTPSNGFLRPHTVAQTPDDRAFTPTPDPIIDAFVATGVMPSVSVSPQCSSAHEVRMEFGCGAKPVPLLGGNALAAQNGNGSPPGTWHASGPPSPEFICGRHQFSVNTCNGCHTCDTATPFTHVDNQAGIPARLSGFLLGETVDDTQFAGVSWKFADLDRRYQDLYAVAGAACFPVIPSRFDIFEEIGLNPFDPIIDFDVFEQLLDIRTQFANPELTLDPMLADIGRGPPPVH